MTTAICERNAFTRSLIEEVSFDVGATRTDGHGLRADPSTAFRDGVEVSEFIVENGEFSFAPKFPSKSTAVMVN